MECAEAWLEAAPGAASAALQQAVQFAKGWYLLVKDPKDSGGEWAAQALLRALPAPGGAPHRHVASLLRSLPVPPGDPTLARHVDTVWWWSDLNRAAWTLGLGRLY